MPVHLDLGRGGEANSQSPLPQRKPREKPRRLCTWTLGYDATVPNMNELEKEVRSLRREVKRRGLYMFARHTKPGLVASFLPSSP